MDRLNKLYVEITTACNLDSRACVHHAWRDITGTMPVETFRALIEQVCALPDPPTVQLCGYGEPMMHPRFLELVQIARAAGVRLELFTNGLKLTPIISSVLVDLGLERIIVALDAVTRDRGDAGGGDPRRVIENAHKLARIKQRRGGAERPPQVTILFVLMRRNAADLAHLPRLAQHVGAAEVIVTNVVPYRAELQAEMLYRVTGKQTEGPPAASISLPRFDLDIGVLRPLHRLLSSGASARLPGNQPGCAGRCPFACAGAAAVRWDGVVSPCLPLLHDHEQYPCGERAEVAHYAAGSIARETLGAIWEQPEYAAFRARLRDEPFSAAAPCGDCLWAQGFAQCP